MDKKLYLKGFANLGFFNIEEDTQDSYKTETTRTKLPSARSCAPTDNRTAFSIPGDDGVWASGSEWTSTSNEIVINEIDLETLAALTGASVNEDGSIDEGSFDNAPPIAMNYSALRADGGYRLFLYYCCKVTNVKVSHNTKSSESTDAQTYTLTFECTPRKYDGKIRKTIDIEKGASLEWLNNIASVPAANVNLANPSTPTPNENEGA